jgi:hypothetical protein
MRPSLRPPWPPHTFLLRWHPRAPHSIPRRIATTSSLNAAPVDLPKLILSPGSSYHNSLPTFLQHAKRTNLPPVSSVYVGTHYEYTAALSLMRLGFSLLRVGGQGDGGVDLIGHWVLAPLREPLPVIIQCKARKAALSPHHVREMEGSFQAIPVEWQNKDVLGLIVTTCKATKGTLAALSQCRWPMGFVLISRAGTVQQFVWNRAASDRALEGVGVTLRHTPRILLPDIDAESDDVAVDTKATKKHAKFKTAGTKKDIQLTWMGSPIFPDRHVLDEETLQLLRTLEPLEKDTPRIRKGAGNTSHHAPVPRGGLITGQRGPGRPTGSRDQLSRPVGSPKLRGRPRGSKNKPKMDVDAR